MIRSVEVGASAVDAFDAFTRVSDLLSWLCEGALVGRVAAGLDRERRPGLTLEYCFSVGDRTTCQKLRWAPVLVP